MAEYHQFPCAEHSNSVSTSARTTTTIISTSQQKCSNLTSSSSIAVGSVVGDKIKKISTLFFDLDNTLIPTRSGDSKACRKLAEVLETKFGFSKEESTSGTQSFLKAFRRCPDNSQTSLDSWRTYLWREALAARHKHLAEQVYVRWLQLRYRQLALPAEYVGLLRGFRERGYRLALITNGPSNAQWEKIRKLNVAPYFDCILVSSDLPWEKPNPNIFYAACNYLGVKPAQCAMIGDKLETDIMGGHLAGLGATFWTPLNQNTGVDMSEEAYPPDIVLRNVLDLYPYFGLNGSYGCNMITNGVTGTVTHMTTSMTTIQAKARRSSQQLLNPTTATTSTCKHSDHNPFQHFTAMLGQHNQQQLQQQQQKYAQQSQQKSSKYRRGGSLPAYECTNSETENSSDSLFN